MIKRPFLAFSIIMTVLVTAMIATIQSRSFASLVKKTAARYMPADPGIEGDFSEFAIKLFPPGISIRDPRITVHKKNMLGLPPGSSVTAERLDLTFRLFQMFSGTIRVSEVAIVNGDIHLALGALSDLGAAPSRKKRFELRWDELFQIHAEAVALRNCKLSVKANQPRFSGELLARSLTVEQAKSNAGLGYKTGFELEDLRGEFPRDWRVPKKLDRIAGNASGDAESLRVEQLAVRDSIGGTPVEVVGGGTIHGNVLRQKDLRFESSLRLTGSLAPLSAHVLPAKLLPRPSEALSGQVFFSGKVNGNLQNLDSSLQAQGNLRIESLRYKSWSADHLQAEASWTGTGGGELQVSKAIVDAAEIPRAGGTQPGHGGRIEAGPFKLLPGNLQRFTVPIKFERAHLHWLAAPLLKDVYPLDLRVSGPVTLEYSGASAGTPWKILARTRLDVENLQLDNQRLNQTRPMNKVLDIPETIRAIGDIRVDAQGVHPLGLEVSLPRTKLKLDGKVDFKSGYDLRASGPVNLADIREIAANAVHGEGSLGVRVHGPSTAVLAEFDLDVKNAAYLNLALGALKGKITWDDEREQVVFTQVQLQQGKTPYLGNGAIDIGASPSIDLRFQIAHGYVQDFVRVMDYFTRDIWWFPHSLTGGFTGNISVTGGLSMDKLKVLARGTGADWEYLNERFRGVAITGGYDQGTYYVGDLYATKRAGRVLGRISYDPQGKFDWDFRTEQFSLTDIDLFAQLDVPMRGRVAISSAGRGTAGALKSETFASLTDFSVRGTAMAPSQLSVTTEAGVIKANGTALGNQGALELSYDSKPGAPSFVRTQFRHLDYSALLLLLNPGLSQDPELAAFFSGGVQMTFRSGAADRGTGTVDISEFILRKSSTAFRLISPAQIRVKDGSFELSDLGVRGNQGDARLNLSSVNSQLEGSIFGDLDIAAAEFITPTVAQATGTAGLDFTIGGSIREPKIIGKASLAGGSVRISALETPFENITGALQLRQNTINVQNIEGDLAGGRVSADGSIQLHADRFPELNLKAQISGPKLKIYPFQFIKLSGGLTVTGNTIPYLVQGSLTSDSGLIKEKVMQPQKAAGALKSAQYMPPYTSQLESGYPKFRLNIDTRADNGILIQNDLFDAEARGKVTVVNTIETPRIVGTAELIQGKMVFKNRTFQIHSAGANFDNPAVINPLFNLTATTDVDNTKIQLYAAGRVSSWKAELTSNPVLPESEIISMLTMGITPTEAKRLSAQDRSVVEQGEAASLLLHSLDFNREVHSKTGFQIQLGESVDSQTGASISRPQSSAETAAAPKIVIKKQVTSKLDVSLGSTVGLGTSNRREANAEYRVTPGFSVIGVWDSYDAPDVQERKSYGLDLKWQRRFK